jgi:A/G-specific adenine glycosylase
MNESNFISKQLIEWYQLSKRDLPWRNTHNPYKIWISEIILQQTRVIQGLEYYKRFINRFPNVKSLAAAEEQEVLTYWQGLGYYSRARNLHSAAKTIVNEYKGEFPKNYHSILKLKGIGEYTAAAITSFAWNMPYPVVDGNVFRVLSRLFAIEEPIDTNKGKKYFTELAEELMDKKQAGLFNQAIMEFGALQCTPSAPSCSVCPLEAICLAKAQNAIVQYPVKQNKTKTKDVYLYYFHIRDSEYLYLKQRKGQGIWQNLFEFPLIESETSLSFEEISQNSLFKKWFPAKNNHHFKLIVENKKHILSHRILYVHFYTIEIDNEEGLKDFVKVHPKELGDYPVHRLMQYYFSTFIAI